MKNKKIARRKLQSSPAQHKHEKFVLPAGAHFSSLSQLWEEQKMAHLKHTSTGKMQASVMHNAHQTPSWQATHSLTYIDYVFPAYLFMTVML